ncbi:MAG: hypothetical protein IRZ08_16320 [Frankia sp.]|nr:hypothetical protein [Frankia sp.]
MDSREPDAGQVTTRGADTQGRPAGTSPLTAGPQPAAGTGHSGSTGAWTAVLLIILGFALGAFALATHLLVLWILTGVSLVAGGVMALTSRIMEQVR